MEDLKGIKFYYLGSVYLVSHPVLFDQALSQKPMRWFARNDNSNLGRTFSPEYIKANRR